MPQLPAKYTKTALTYGCWYSDDGLIELYHGDALRFLGETNNDSVEMIFADPPYNIGFSYDKYDDDRIPSDYLGWVLNWLEESARVVAPGGSVWVMCHASYFGWFERLIETVGLEIISRVIWRYTFGQNQRDRFTPSWVPVFYAVKPPARLRTFWGDSIRVPSARQTVYRDKRANPLGKVPDDVWDIPRLVGTAAERVGHPCQLPMELVRRAVLACTSEGETVLDPFVGSGTTPAVCQALGRKCIGMEVSEAYLTDFAIPRLL